MQNKISIGVQNTIDVCMNMKKNEKLIVVCEQETAKMAKKLVEYAAQKGVSVKTIDIDQLSSRPVNSKTAQTIIHQVSRIDAALISVRYLHQEFQNFLLPLSDLVRRSSVRMAFLFDLNEQLMMEGMNADYFKIKKINGTLIHLLKDAKKIHVHTKKGTEFDVDLGYQWASLDGFPSKGKWVNLPDSEVFTTPMDVNGKVVVDGVVEEFENKQFGLLYPLHSRLLHSWAYSAKFRTCLRR